MRFIETIKIENGIIYNLAEHKARAADTIYYHFGIRKILPFEELIGTTKLIASETYKLRVVYSKEIEEFSIELYSPKKVISLNLVDGAGVDYRFKSENRSQIDNLLKNKENCDDILIIKNGLVTDTSYSNIVFSKEEKLYTPSTYLLNGIKRQHLINRGVVAERVIKVEEIELYDKYFLINSMLDLYPIEKICRYNF